MLSTLAVSTFLVSACGAAAKERLVTRAAFDLNCPKEDLQVVVIDGRTRGVSGCGQRATYVCTTVVAGTHCTWVLNGDARAALPQ